MHTTYIYTYYIRMSFKNIIFLSTTPFINVSFLNVSLINFKYLQCIFSDRYLRRRFEKLTAPSSRELRSSDLLVTSIRLLEIPTLQLHNSRQLWREERNGLTTFWTTPWSCRITRKQLVRQNLISIWPWTWYL